jgi:hypothetical protein
MTDEDDRAPTLEEMVAESRRRLTTLENSLPERIDPIGISRTKLPSKVLNYREALIWRVAELARAALQAFEAQQLAAAIVLTRAAVETHAALWYLDEKVGTALKQEKLGDLDDCVIQTTCRDLCMGGVPKPHSRWKVRGMRRTQRAWISRAVRCAQRICPSQRAWYNGPLFDS